ncbi:putative phosphatidylglycerol protein [Thermochaetoides thermophila DSM 1495]|uniref:Phosphatidylglycerol/phosphatidylinositol transfer protein n=1 Tax=Chaetomium thermophilum (strain DSM 1495 / CBS 144.50 / IMI 039719) TaxID=759272 RepID=G0S3R7_CHATD|nr:putative phosphatidylglycerol protein [Thermochaetoides thermophila DSM 1495]EGS21193.1 putative phosphatidylglycerol protein [Thermochaetoides thermophila DSM 1495]
MRLSVPFLALIAAGANALSINRRGELDVPGHNPLKFCDPDRSNDLITIEEVNLEPNPPQAGDTLVIRATGTVKETIEDGAYVNLDVRYGYIKLISTQADLCKEIKNVELTCPIEKGKIEIFKTIDLPKEIPPGRYIVQADVYSKDDEHITCLTATVYFKPKPIGRPPLGNLLGGDL